MIRGDPFLRIYPRCLGIYIYYIYSIYRSFHHDMCFWRDLGNYVCALVYVFSPWYMLLDQVGNHVCILYVTHDLSRLPRRASHPPGPTRMALVPRPPPMPRIGLSHLVRGEDVAWLY